MNEPLLGPFLSLLLPPSDTTDTTDWADAPYEKILPYNEDSMLVIEFTPFGDTLALDTVSIPSRDELAAQFDSVIARIKVDFDMVMLLDIQQERVKLKLVEELEAEDER